MNPELAAAHLHGMQQYLLTLAASGRLPDTVLPRGVVSRHDALDAVIHVAGFLEMAAQAGALRPETARHGAAALMVIREYIQPLPPMVIKPEGPDLVTGAVTATARAIRQAGSEGGVQG